MIEPKVYLTAKKGELPKSCQDAYCFNENKTRFAVADGATREFFSAKIAYELVDRFCLDSDESNKNIFLNKKYEEWLKPIQKKWLSYVENIVHNKKKKVNYAVKNRFNRREAGASTFVGLEIDKELFTTMIIGDSCLFHIRDNKILKCYLIDDPDEFDNSPEFFFSRDASTMIPVRTFTEPEVVDGKYEIGDYFLLASDAISKFFLTQQREGKWEDLWKNLLKNDRNWYDTLIETERANKNLDDDDVAILIVPTINTPELISFSKKETYSIAIDRSKEIKNINNISTEQRKSLDAETEDTAEIQNENSGVLESDTNDSIELKKEESIDIILNEQSETPDNKTEDEVELKNEISIALKSDIKGSITIKKEESIVDSLTVKSEILDSEIDGAVKIVDDTFDKNIVVLMYENDESNEVNFIKYALTGEGIEFIEHIDELKIKYTSGILILIERKISPWPMRKETIIRTYSRFSKERKENYDFKEKYQTYIQMIGEVKSNNVKEIVEVINKELCNG